MASMIPLAPGLHLDESEIRFRFSRSGGPGGQHVNKVESKVELLFDVGHTRSLPERVRIRVFETHASRIDGDGVLHLFVDDSRSQHENREMALLRLIDLLRAAAKPRKVRKPTRPTAGSKAEKARRKRRQGEKKRLRRVSRRDLVG